MTPKSYALELGVVCVVALLACSCASGSGDGGADEGNGHVFVTWPTLEPDKLASIWLIKRFVDPQARIEFVEKGELVSYGVPFDTPDAELRRYHDRSCFQSILEKYEIDDEALIRIGEITYDIEINYWADKRFPESQVLIADVQSILDTHPSNQRVCVDEALALFDRLLESVR